MISEARFGTKDPHVCDQRWDAEGRSVGCNWGMVETNGRAAAPPGPVVVGVNGGLAGCRQALVFAAQEARLRNAPIRLVHGCDPLATLTERQPSVPMVARERQARRQLRDAADAVRPLLNADTMVEFRIDPRTGIDALLDESTTAELIVLQRRELTTLGRITAGSTSNAVAARAHCPVAVTRAGSGSTPHRGGVLLGVHGQAGLDAAVQLAFIEAALRRARLTIHLLTHSDAEGGHASSAGEASVAVLEGGGPGWADLISRYARRFPEVVLARVVVAGDSVDTLRAATESAELLVISRHDGGQDGDLRSLGSRARQLINTSRCPILVAAPTHPAAHDSPSLVAPISDARPRSSASSPR